MRFRGPLLAVVIAMLPFSAQAQQPKGDGDPLAITCTKPQNITGWRLKARPICKTNAEWAQLDKDGMAVAADGRLVPAEKNRNINPQACLSSPAGGGGVNNMNQMNFGAICF
jgi:hypothetical protein